MALSLSIPERPILDAVDVWEIEEVSWMWDSENKAVMEECASLQTFRAASREHTSFLEVALSMRTPALKQDPMFVEMAKADKMLEAGCVENGSNPISRNLFSRGKPRLSRPPKVWVVLQTFHTPSDEPCLFDRNLALALAKSCLPLELLRCS